MMRVAVTGARGRLGSALLAAFGERGIDARPWTRPGYDLDDPSAPIRSVQRDEPQIVVHAAAWTDVDGCAREPDLAFRRNAEATGSLALVCAARGISLVVVSTNEVFDGERRSGAYAPSDPPRAINPYGASKLRGEALAAKAYERAVGGAALGIARTAWLFGPPGNDFPEKIVRAARRAMSSGQSLRVVSDEIGSPSYTVDVADGIAQLVETGCFGGIHHVVNGGAVSRAEWAEAILADVQVPVPIEQVSVTSWPRPSTPPLRAPLEQTELPLGPLRSWREATSSYVRARELEGVALG